MHGLETTVLIGAAVLVGLLLSPKLRLETPLTLLLMGLLLGFIPQVRAIELPPETVLLLFLPAMLFWESLTTSLRAILRDLRDIALLSTLLVVATAFAVAAVAHAFGLPWAAAPSRPNRRRLGRAARAAAARRRGTPAARPWRPRLNDERGAVSTRVHSVSLAF
jgi:hypothetical protein